MISLRLSDARRLWAAAGLLSVFLAAYDALLAAHLVRSAATPASSLAILGPIVARRCRRFGRRPLVFCAPLVAALCDAGLAPPPRRRPCGSQALALAVTAASIAVLAPVSYGPWGAGLFLAALVVLLRRIRDRGS
jgi:hypothetical protein